MGNELNFDRLYKLFREARSAEVKPSTSALFAMHWKKLAPKIGANNISSFGQVEARLLLSELFADGLGPKTAKDRIAFIKQMLLFASTVLGISVMPLQWKLKYPEREPRKIKSFTESEMIRIVKYGMADIKAGRLTILPMLISILTGMRIGETLGLKWGDIDWTHNVISVHRNVVKTYDPEKGADMFIVGTPKTKQGYRDIPLLPSLRNILRATAGKSFINDYYVVGNSPKPKKHNTVREAYSRFLKRHNLPDINFHGLRHTYATLLVENGVDIKTVSELLGHSQVAFTMDLYVHPSISTKKKAANHTFRKLKTIETTN